MVSGYRVFVVQMKKILETVMVFVQHCECSNVPDLYTSEWLKSQILCYVSFIMLKIFLNECGLFC